MKKLYYFAYGSNMLLERILRRVGMVRKVDTFALRGYELAFNTGSDRESYANLLKSSSEDDFVEGVLYELDDRQVAQLDRFEGYPFCYQKQYLVHPDGNVIFTYVSTDPEYYSVARPSVWYLSILIQGADENGLIYTKRMLQQYAKSYIAQETKNKKKKNDTVKR